MLISDVSLAKIADEFIAYLQSQPAFPAGEAANFLVVAASLLLLKSKALLPTFAVTEDEEGDIKDLEHRLALYQVFRTVARTIGVARGRLYFGGLRRDTTPVFAPAPDMTAEALRTALQRALAQAPTMTHVPETVVAAVVSIEEMMARLATRIERALTITFKDFVGSPEDKREVVVGFLAMLELVKRGLVMVEQGTHFAEITMKYEGTGQTPRYD